MRSRLLAALIALSSSSTFGKAPSADAEAAYQQARTSYYALKGDEARRKFRHNWLNVIQRFEGVAARYPKSERAPDALFTAAQTLEELSRISRLDEDLSSAMTDYGKLTDVHPRHPLADDAAYQLARIQRDRLGRLSDARKTAARALVELPRGDRARELKALLASLPASPADEEKAHASAEKRDKREPQPVEPRAAVDRKGRLPDGSADAAPSVERKTESDKRTEQTKLGEERVAESRSDAAPSESITASGEPSQTSRLALVEAIERLARSQAPLYEQRAEVPAEMEAEAELAAHKTAAEKSAVERGREQKTLQLAAVDQKIAKARLKGAVVKDSGFTLAEQLGLKVRRIVIDPGHGGHDSGAVGASGTQEKDVALAISKKLAKELTRAGLEVVLTRDEDTFVRLEHRADFANDERGDLFISVHCNSAPKKKLRGVEVYTLNTSADRYSIRLAARENASSEKSISDLQFILADLATKANTEESSNLANQVQRSLVTRLSTRYKDIKDLGHKQALFYVLLGTRMPAILVETSFLSNPEEEKRLASGEYQDAVAQAIAAGVQEFLGHREKVAKID